MSENQAQTLAVEAYTRWSFSLVQYCLLLSANEAYARAAEDIAILAGMTVPHSTQQRLVHRQIFEAPKVSQVVAEMSVDGGKGDCVLPREKRVSSEIIAAAIQVRTQPV